MLVRTLIGDRFGQILTEVQARVESTTWILNGIGRTAISLALSDAKATEENLRIGNRLYLAFDNGLPDWGGVLDMPRNWSHGMVAMTAYELPWLLQWRCTRKNDAFYERPAGLIFRELLRREEEQDPLGITFGSIWMGGHPHWPRYHYKSLWYVLDYSLRRMERCDFRFIPYIDNGRILFRASLYQEAGDDKSASVALVEGRNIAAGFRLAEKGQIINSYYAVGEGSTWGTERVVVAARDNESIATYGLREVGKIHSGVSEQSTLEMHARNALDTNSQPRKIFTLPVTDHEPGLFAAYDLGDTVNAIIPSYGFSGFDGTLRVIAREFNPATGACDLVVEEPHSVEPWVYQDEAEEEPE
ncbi:MAG: hypothetical protein JXC32_20705 [Anaerolineae bacterium]|nr:hypothetical protein [Anaerolineae bacterium]